MTPLQARKIQKALSAVHPVPRVMLISVCLEKSRPRRRVMRFATSFVDWLLSVK